MSDRPVPSPLRGIVVGHGGMAAGLVDAVERIAGPQEGILVAISNDECGPDLLRNRIREALGEVPGILFVDMESGSCAFAVRHLDLAPGVSGAVFGVNLPMLLDFVFNRDLDPERLIPRLQERGRDGVRGRRVDGAPCRSS